ncbi:MAG: DUF4037 domain-containing protein [Anaerolineae bacterium]
MAITTPLLDTAHQIAADFSALPDVLAVALSGSVGGGHSDAGSDIDLYVYSHKPILAAEREVVIRQRASRCALNNRFWEDGDEWVEAESGIEVDLICRQPQWIADQIERVLVRHEASTGYSTCFWYNVLHSTALYDPTGWYAGLQQHARQPYPEALVPAIIAKNHPPLRDMAFSAYTHQLEKAIKRGDLVSLNHRVAALLASYFDIVFAVNRLPHPGEKRLLALAEKHCEKHPVNMREDIETLLQAAGRADESALTAAYNLLDHLDELLVKEGLLPRPHTETVLRSEK